MERARKQKHARNEVVDLELNCVRCNMPLYAPVEAARGAVATVQSGGAAILMCSSCGQAQFIRRKQQRKTHD